MRFQADLEPFLNNEISGWSWTVSKQWDFRLILNRFQTMRFQADLEPFVIMGIIFCWVIRFVNLGKNDTWVWYLILMSLFRPGWGVAYGGTPPRWFHPRYMIGGEYWRCKKGVGGQVLWQQLCSARHRRARYVYRRGLIRYSRECLNFVPFG